MVPRSNRVIRLAPVYRYVPSSLSIALLSMRPSVLVHPRPSPSPKAAHTYTYPKPPTAPRLHPLPRRHPFSPTASQLPILCHVVAISAQYADSQPHPGHYARSVTAWPVDLSRAVGGAAKPRTVPSAPFFVPRLLLICLHSSSLAAVSSVSSNKTRKTKCGSVPRQPCMSLPCWSI